MFGEAFMGLDLTPDPTGPKFLSFPQEDTNSTQPEFGDLVQSTPVSAILATGDLETPRYFLNVPSPLPCPLPYPQAQSSGVLLPSPQSADLPQGGDLLQDSPLPALTAFGDLPTPRGWIRTPDSMQKFSPSIVLQTPPSNLDFQPPFQGDDVEPQLQTEEYVDHPEASSPNEFNEAPSQQAEEPNPQPLEVNISFRSPLHVLDTPEGGEIRHIAIAHPNEIRAKSYPGGHRRKQIRELDGLPEVRRKLFDINNEDEGRDPKLTNAAKMNIRESVSSVPCSSNGSQLSSPGLKSRLAPPPPISIPGPPNTTPGGIHLISKKQVMTKKDSKNLKVANASFFRQLPASVVQGASVQQHQKQVKRQQALAAQQRKRRSREKSQVEEERPVMSERASQVLAEMRRQMSESQSDTEKVSLGASSKAANSLPCSSAVGAPPNTKKEIERPICNCKASQCIKRYCPCFATSNFCGKGCGCLNCENSSQYSSVVGRARRVLLERDPNAFVPRIRNARRSSGRGRQTIKGCNCRKGCGKNYCICRENGLICGVRCTCSGPRGCQNYDKSKLDEVPKVIENAHRPGHSSIAVLKSEPLYGSTAGQTQAGMSQVPQQIAQPTVNSNLVHHLNLDIDAIGTSQPGLGPFDVLPTPTNPCLPDHGFFKEEPVNNKRRVILGNPADTFKKIRVGDPDGKLLPQMRQSSKFGGTDYKTPSPKLPVPPGSLKETPLTSRVLLAQTPNVDNGNVVNEEPPSNSNMNFGSVSADVSNSEGRLSHVPRIFRYKFGSGQNASSFTFKPKSG